MAAKIIKNMKFDFIINDNSDIDPLLFFTEPSLEYYTNDICTKLETQDSTHSVNFKNIIYELQQKIFTRKYYGDDNGQIDNNNKYIRRYLANFLKWSNNETSIENKFNNPYEIVTNSFDDINILITNLYRILKINLMKLPISNDKFPRYERPSIDLLQKREDRLNEIINKINNEEDDKKKLISFEELIEFYCILSTYDKAYSLPPSLVLSALSNFDVILNSLLYKQRTISKEEKIENDDLKFFNAFRNLSSEIYNEEERSIRNKYFQLIMLLKMRLYLIIQKMHDSLSILLQFIILEEQGQIKYDDEDDDRFSFKKFFTKSLPKTKQRSKIITNISLNSILDFFINTENNEILIITKSGIFYTKEQQQRCDLVPFEFNNGKEEAEIKQILEKEELKFSLLNKTLYALSQKDKTIYVIDINKRPKITKMITVDVEYPIVSFNVDGLIQIVQRKSYIDNKTTFLFKSIDAEDANAKVTEITEFTVEDKKRKHKVIDTCLDSSSLYILYDDLSIEQRKIDQENKFEEITNDFISPYYIKSTTNKFKICKSFMFVIDEVNENAISFSKMHLNETKHFIVSENGVFLNRPYLQQLSDVVDNCCQFIISNKITRTITAKEYHDAIKHHSDLLPFVYDESLHVSEYEMSCIKQSPYSISEQLNKIKALVDELKDENLKCFFVCLFIKLIGINVLYSTDSYYDRNEGIDKLQLNRFKMFKNYIFDLFSMIKSIKSSKFEVMIRESFLFTFTLSAKYLFIPDSYDELHEFMASMFYLNEQDDKHLKEKYILISLSPFVFQYPSLLYILDDPIYNELYEFRDSINLQQLFSESLLFIPVENRFICKFMESSFFNSIEFYIQSLFNYLQQILMDESIELKHSEKILSYLFGINVCNCYYELIVVKNMVKIAPLLYNRIKQVEGVVEKDEQLKQINEDIRRQSIHKKIEIIESNHPSNREKRYTYEKEIDFGNDTQFVYVIFDDKSDIYFQNEIEIKYSINDKERSKSFNQRKDFMFNHAIKFKANKIVFKFRNMMDKDSLEGDHWGYKITFIGVSFDDTFYWKPNPHLYFYNHFIKYLSLLFYDSSNSTSYIDIEKEFEIIMNEKIIQGIKFEDIDNYELNLKQQQQQQQNQTKTKANKVVKRTLTRGISRGISYDSDNDLLYTDEVKKQFINELLTAANNNSDQSKSRGKRLLDFLYTKTAKQNRIRLNESTKSIQIIEHYYAACLIKQLGLINLCLKFVNAIIFEKDIQKVEVPNRLLTLWKKVYVLRQTLFFSYQKSKSIQNPLSLKHNFVKYSDEIKRKCILLLYSDPILKFKSKDNLDDEKIESSAKLIFNFITSEICLSRISELIDCQRNRLSITTQSINLFKSFLEQNLLFESSKLILANEFKCSIVMRRFAGLKEQEINDLNKSYGSLCYEFTKAVYSSNPSFGLISSHKYLSSVFNSNDDESKSNCVKLFIEILNNNYKKKSDTFRFEYFNLIIVSALLSYLSTTDDKEITEFVVSLLFSDKIDTQSKQLILLTIPGIIGLNSVNKEVLLDQSIPFSILSKYKDNPVIIQSTFFWLSSIINEHDKSEFVLKVLKGIGRAFTGKSCLFIDDSFQPFTHRQVAEGMISFIRLLVNEENEITLTIIHDILTNQINKINHDNLDVDLAYILIGLFESIGQTLSAMEPERKLMNYHGINVKTINGYNPTTHKLIQFDSFVKKLNNIYTNIVVIDPRKVKLEDTEIKNILHLHETLSHMKYFVDQLNYNAHIKESEIIENILIVSFYSFLPIIMQSKSNVDLLMSSQNLNAALSLFELSMKKLPSSENSILILSHYLEQAITNEYKRGNDCFDFIRLNYGQISNDNLTIVSDKNHMNVFICSRPFDFECQTYFEVKLKKIGNKHLFIGFVDSTKTDINEAFGFGNFSLSGIFCRKSQFLTKYLRVVNDGYMRSLILKEGDTIGCYYTKEYAYLTLNGELTEYRLYHHSLESYFPLIIIDYDEIELEITKKVTIVSNKLVHENIEWFTDSDIKIINADIYDEDHSEDYYDRHDNDDNKLSENLYFIGQQVSINETISTEKRARMETIEPYSSTLYLHRSNYGIIKDIKPIENNQFVSKLKVESYNSNSLSKELVDLDTRYICGHKTNFFNLVENITNAKLGINGSFSILKNDIKIKTKTIFDNSISIAIIMSRYLAFILVDYLRFIKSKLLQNEGIESKEMDVILKALSFSIPTITSFKPRFKFCFDENDYETFTIFKKDDNCDIFDNFYYIVLPGFSNYFHRSFNLFIKNSESFISPKFYERIIRFSMENASMSSFCSSSSSLYQMIPSNYKMESFVPRSRLYPLEKTIKNSTLKKRRAVGYIPILQSSIPDNMVSVKCNRLKLRVSSDRASYFSFIAWNDVCIKWNYYNYDKNSEFRLKFGILPLYKDLNEDFLNGSLGFVQTIFNIFQGFNSCDDSFLYEKMKDFFSIEFIKEFFSLASKRDILLTPFVQAIVVTLVSRYGFHDSVINGNSFDSSSFFGHNQASKLLVKLKDFPSCSNEFSLLFSIYSTLCKERTNELKCQNSSSIFDEYKSLNDELFKIFEFNKKEEKEKYESKDCRNKNNFIEGEFYDDDDEDEDDIFDEDEDEKNNVFNYNLKNSRSFYLTYYYSNLLCNDKKLPYPMFLFVHEWMRQKFGGFQVAVSKKDFKELFEFDKNCDKVVYKSKVFENDSPLLCSCQLNNEQASEYYHVFVHQIDDDKNIEIDLSNNGDDKVEVEVSFPLEIIISHASSSGDEINHKQFFIIKFAPSEEKQRGCFTENYDQIQKDFNEFVSLSKFDNELFDALNPSSTKETENEEEEENNETATTVTTATTNNNNDDDDEEEEEDEDAIERRKRNSNAYENFNIDKIPTALSVPIPQLPPTASDRIISLRYSIIQTYNRLIENLIFAYKVYEEDDSDDKYEETNWWYSSYNDTDDKNQTSQFMEQIIRPAYSMKTSSKFGFVNNILNKGEEGSTSLDLIFNRFEQQKFFSKFDKDLSSSSSSSAVTARPLFVQLMEQMNEDSIPLMKVRKNPPFTVNLVGEGAYDAGGPGREIFSSLIIEMMNDHLGIFTFNPNYRHNKLDTNKEDLIPNKEINNNLSDDMSQIMLRKFVFVGALIGCCIVSSIPQNMKLSNIIWDYLSIGHLTIESIYEIDDDFKMMIENAESVENLIKENNMDDDEFDNNFLHNFTIKDSFDNNVDLIPSGSKVKVNKQNLHDFIQLAKNHRLHEFDSELEEIKEGFEKIMTFRNITKILHPNELRLLACGEPSCPIKQMKKLILVNALFSYDNPLSERELIKIFWNVIKSFTPLQRMKFIQYSTGNMGLPAEGLQWPKKMSVRILSLEDKNNGDTMIFAHTCSSQVDIPYFENEEELEHMLKIALDNFGIITDGSTRFEEVSPELF